MALNIKELEAILEINRKINSLENLDNILKDISNYAGILMKAEGASILLTDPQTGNLRFRVAFGEGADILTKLEVPKGKGIAGSVAESRQYMIVNDVQNDPRFYQNIDKNTKLMTKNLVAIPMVRGNDCIGVIEVINAEKGYFSEDDIPVLKHFAEQAAIAISNALLYNELQEKAEALRISEEKIREYSENLEKMVEERTEELRKAYENLEEKNNQIEEELKIAQRIQQAIIPKSFNFNSVEIFGIYKPMESLGGDYFDAFSIDDKRLAIVIADVSGHGVPSSLMTMMAKVLFYNEFKNHNNTSEVMKEVNKKFIEAIGNIEYYLSAFIGIIDIEKNLLNYSSAGHPAMFLLKSSREIERLKAKGTYINVFKNSVWEDKFIDFKKDDSIIVFTDGIVEAKNIDNQMFEEFRLIESLKSTINNNPMDLIDNILKEIYKWTDNKKQDDDMTIFAIKRN